MHPGLVAGFASPAASQAFDKQYTEITKDLYWCCAAEGNGLWANFIYERPKPLAGVARRGAGWGWVRWRAAAAVQLLQAASCCCFGLPCAKKFEAFGCLTLPVLCPCPPCCPGPVPQRGVPWEAPLMQLPAWCDKVTPKNQEYVRYANHPCQFLTNITAAQVAAEFS